MGGKKGDEEEMGHPLHILAQIISEQLKSVLISRRCPEAARLKAALEKGGLIQERQRRLEVNLERVLQGGERWGRASRLREGHCSRPTAPTPLLAPTPHVGPPFLSCNAPPLSNPCLRSFPLRVPDSTTSHTCALPAAHPHTPISLLKEMFPVSFLIAESIILDTEYC